MQRKGKRPVLPPLTTAGVNLIKRPVLAYQDKLRLTEKTEERAKPRDGQVRQSSAKIDTGGDIEWR